MLPSAAGTVEQRRRPHHMERSVRLGLAALLVLACTACNPHVFGNGEYATRTFPVEAFDSLEVEYGYTALVEISNVPRSLQISGDENVVSEHVTVEVVDSTLRIGHSVDFTPIHAVTISIQTPVLVAVRAREGSRVTVMGANAAAFGVHASESSDVILSGAPGAGAALTAALDTGASLDAHAFPVASAAVTLTDHSDAKLHCSGPVTGSASGASSIRVEGGGTCEVALTASTCTPLP